MLCVSLVKIRGSCSHECEIETSRTVMVFFFIIEQIAHILPSCWILPLLSCCCCCCCCAIVHCWRCYVLFRGKQDNRWHNATHFTIMLCFGNSSQPHPLGTASRPIVHCHGAIGSAKINPNPSRSSIVVVDTTSSWFLEEAAAAVVAVLGILTKQRADDGWRESSYDNSKKIKQNKGNWMRLT